MPGANYDYELEREAILRKRKIAEALQAQALGPMRPQPSGTRTSSLAAIAPIIQQLFANKINSDSDAKQKDFTQRYETGLAQGMSDYERTSGGYTRDAAAQGPMPDGSALQGMVQEEVPGDRRKAILDALATNHPGMREFALKQAAEQQKGQMSQKDFLSLSGYDAKSKIAAALAGDPNALAPEAKERVVNGQIVIGDPAEGFVRAGDFRDKFGNVGQVGSGPDGKPIFGQPNTTTGEVKFAPGGGVTVNTGDGKGGLAFQKAVGEKRAKILEDSFNNATSANKALEAITNASADLQAGIKSGASAEIALALSKWGKAVGIEADPAITNTESFRANMARETMQLVKNLGSGTAISNADLKFAEQASGGKITLDDKAMARLMGVAKAAAGNVLLDHDRLLQRNRNAPGGDDGSVDTFRVPFSVTEDDHVMLDEKSGKWTVRQPGSKATKPAGGVMSAEDYLKSKGF